jgi:phosphomannomutase/phosphoglucomutase
MGAKISPAIFREYDIRGLTPDELTPETGRIVALAFAEWLAERGGTSPVALVGRDNRHSSPGLALGVIQGFAQAGWRVVDLGIVPTPVLYWVRCNYEIDAGVMVTGSHNEARYNGFKLAAGPGTIYGADIQDVGRRASRLALAARPDLPKPAPGAGSKDIPADVLPSYLADLEHRTRPAQGGRPLRVAVDCGSGTGALVAPALFRRLGHEVLPLYCELDGAFPGHWPDPVRAENLSQLRELVVREEADLGVAFDGDGDRLGVVDDRGEILWGDEIMILYWREILARHPGAKALVEVKCSRALIEEISRLGGEPLFCRTGHSLVKARMREVGAPFAGEMSGHMFFADEYYGFDDAFYAAARLLRLLATSARPLSTLLGDRPRYFTSPETRLDCPDEIKFRVVEAVGRRFALEGHEIITVDGARVVFPGGDWLLVRASNTQPALVTRCEARTEEELGRLQALVAEAVNQATSEVMAKPETSGKLTARQATDGAT